jgi:hypothetical protein
MLGSTPTLDLHRGGESGYESLQPGLIESLPAEVTVQDLDSVTIGS